MLPDALTIPGCTKALSNVAIMFPQWHNKVSHPTFPRAAPLPNTGPELPTEQITHSCDAGYKAEPVSWALG